MRVRMKAPEGCKSIGLGGESHAVNEDGTIEVEKSMVEAAQSHGFVIVAGKTAEELEAERAAAEGGEAEGGADDLVDGEDQRTNDQLRDAIEAANGKRPGSRTSRAKLLEQLAELEAPKLDAPEEEAAAEPEADKS